MKHPSSPLVSVIVPCYNYGHFLPETIASLQQQTYRHWECIVVDDGSQDNAREVCAELWAQDTCIRYIHQANGGLSNARNTGLKVAQGEYIQLLDADDMLGSLKLALNVDFLHKNPDIDIVYGQVQYFQRDNNAQFSCSIDMRDLPWMPCVSGKGKPVLQELIRENIMVVNAPMIRHSLVTKVGWFDEALLACEGWDYWIRCAASGSKFHYDGSYEAVALVRTHPTSMVNEKHRMFQACIAMRTKVNKIKETNDRDVKNANLKTLLALIARDYFHHLYQGSVIRGAKGIAANMKRWGNYGLFISNSLYWFRRRLSNS